MKLGPEHLFVLLFFKLPEWYRTGHFDPELRVQDSTWSTWPIPIWICSTWALVRDRKTVKRWHLSESSMVAWKLEFGHKQLAKQRRGRWQTVSERLWCGWLAFLCNHWSWGKTEDINRRRKSANCFFVRRAASVAFFVSWKNMMNGICCQTRVKSVCHNQN